MGHNIHLIFEGLLFGAVFYEAVVICRMRKPCGVLRIDRKADPELYRFEIDELDSLSKKKYVRLKVDNDACLSQK